MNAQHEVITPGPISTVLEIDVNNHAGVMSHIVGLFARRACNIEGIVCIPSADGLTSRIWFLVRDEKLPQMTKHVGNLEDVRAVRRRDKFHDSFKRLPELFG